MTACTIIHVRTYEDHVECWREVEHAFAPDLLGPEVRYMLDGEPSDRETLRAVIEDAEARAREAASARAARPLFCDRGPGRAIAEWERIQARARLDRYRGCT